MREFFKGWRRKAGCVTLALACFLMGGWNRSLVTSDTFIFGDGFVTLSKGSIEWMRLVHEDNTPIETPKTDAPAEVTIAVISGGVKIGNPNLKVISYTIPYWSLTIPMTVLSAYLLLWKPRKRTAAEHA